MSKKKKIYEISNDMLNKKCRKCKKGKYYEWSFYCDRGDEPLKCNKCGHKKQRWTETEIKTGVIMSKGTKAYQVGYTEIFVDSEGRISKGIDRIFYCHAESKAAALIRLINLEAVFEVHYIVRTNSE